MNTSTNNFDALESLIHSEGIFIQVVDIHQEHDLLSIVLNTKAVLRQKISNFSSLHKATKAQLMNYQLIGKGTGIHWPQLDEDLSLKGFLREELKSLINKPENLAA